LQMLLYDEEMTQWAEVRALWGAAHPSEMYRPSPTHIAHKVFSKSFCERQFPHKFGNLFFI